MNAKKFTKKPVEIEAMRFRDWSDALQIMHWAAGTSIYFVPQGYEHSARYESELDRSNGHTLQNAQAFLMVRTLEGWMRASVGDMIIRGIKGEFYPCKPDIFKESYDEKMEDE